MAFAASGSLTWLYALKPKNGDGVRQDEVTKPLEPGGVSSQRDEAPPGPEPDLQAKLSFHSARTEGALDSDSESMEATEKLLQL